jgi:hypothetical protein
MDSTMTAQQAKDRAAQLGLSTWVTHASVIGGDSGDSCDLKCVGFADLELALGEGETWEEAFTRATRLIYSAQ